MEWKKDDIRPPLTKRRQVLKDTRLVYKYPRTISSIVVTATMLVYFSKPIYDLFFSKREFPDISEAVPPKLLRSQRSRETQE